ncbi:MAG: FHA domain-containing protein [Victivallales bacterium]|nr:FHA domain-containing protein [Victivallales bacterium]
MSAKLMFLDKDKGEESYELNPDGTTLGRETDNDIILQEGEISRHHARIIQKDGKWIFKDLGSSSGTKVNDIPVKDSEQALNPGDVILIGRHRLKFETGICDVTIMGGLQAPQTEIPAEVKPAPSSPAPATPAAAEARPEARKESPAKQAPPTSKPKTSPASNAAKKKGGGKFLFGCGGCGCLLTLILLPAGIFMLVMGNDSHMSELGPFGMILTPIAGLVGLVALILIIIGFFSRKKG